MRPPGLGYDRPVPEDAGALVEAAWEHLGEGRWEQARATFEVVLEHDELPEALQGLGDALLWLGDPRGSVAAHERAYTLFRRRPEPLLAGLCAIALYYSHRVSLGNVAASKGWLGRLARLVDDHGLEPLAGWVALVRANDSADRDAAEAHARTALAAARAAADVDLELCALSQLGAVLVDGGHIADGIALLDEALAGSLAGEGSSLDTVVMTSCLMIQCCSHAAEFERAAEWVRLSDGFVARYGSPHLFTVCRLHLGRVLIATGRWQEAQTELARALASARASERGVLAEVLAALAELRIAQGRLDEAGRLLVGAQDHHSTACARVALLLARGETGVARALARRRLRAAGEQRLESAALVELAVAVELAHGDSAHAAAIADRLAQFAERSGSSLVVARAERALGLTRGGGPAARTHLERALEHFSRLGMVHETARTRLLLAEHLREDGADAAIAEARAAQRTFEELGASRDADAAGALLRELGVKAARLPGPRGAALLSRREREVLVLLGEGLTNRAIAERLFLAPKTVEHHVRSVLAKLGLERRAEAAAYAARHPESAVD